MTYYLRRQRYIYVPVSAIIHYRWDGSVPVHKENVTRRVRAHGQISLYISGTGQMENGHAMDTVNGIYATSLAEKRQSFLNFRLATADITVHRGF